MLSAIIGFLFGYNMGHDFDSILWIDKNHVICIFHSDFMEIRSKFNHRLDRKALASLFQEYGKPYEVKRVY